jgi:hypothetical protein
MGRPYLTKQTTKPAANNERERMKITKEQIRARLEAADKPCECDIKTMTPRCSVDDARDELKAHAPSDLRHLLSLVEVYEKALERVRYLYLEDTSPEQRDYYDAATAALEKGKQLTTNKGEDHERK